MKIETYTEVAPACWASYIINDDPSSLSDAEIKACDKWIDDMAKVPDGHEFMHITIEDDAKSYFWRWHGDWGQKGVVAGDLLNYTVVYRVKE